MTGYVLKRYSNRVRIIEGVGVYGGEFFITQGHKLVDRTNDRDEAEATAEILANDWE